MRRTEGKGKERASRTNRAIDGTPVADTRNSMVVCAGERRQMSGEHARPSAGDNCQRPQIRVRVDRRHEPDDRKSLGMCHAPRQRERRRFAWSVAIGTVAVGDGAPPAGSRDGGPELLDSGDRHTSRRAHVVRQAACAAALPPSHTVRHIDTPASLRSAPRALHGSSRRPRRSPREVVPRRIPGPVRRSWGAMLAARSDVA